MAKKLDKVEVVVVGAGWSGGIAAAELTKEGYEVVSLEKGKDRKLEDFIGSKDELRYYIRGEMMEDLQISTFTSRNTLEDEALPVRSTENRWIGDGVGGSGVHWNGFTYRWLPSDFEIYTHTVDKYGEDKIPDYMTIKDWGITYDELEPYYDKFEKTAGISGEPSPLGPPRSNDYPNPPMKDNAVTRLFKETTESMGYHPYQQPSANMSKQYTNPDGETINQCMYCSFCEKFGCDFGAKADPISTVLSTAQKTGRHELRTDCYVTEVLHEDGKATGVLYRDLKTGEEIEQPADMVVLAAYVFTNARILLLSEIGEPYDPETREGIIGKNFTGHFGSITYKGARAYFDDTQYNYYAGAGALGAVIDDFNFDNIDNSEHDFLHGFEVHVKEFGGGPLTRGINVPEGTPGFGSEFKKNLIHYMSRNINVLSQSGGLPAYHNYFDLDPNYVDAFGIPVLRVTNHHTEQDYNLNKFALEKCKEIAEELGADIVDMDVMEEDVDFNHTFYSTHYGGGVIMGDSDEDSAVNTFSQMWDMENLFVVGSSVFPHFGNYNPTGTVGALAYRATEGMLKYLSGDGGLLVESKSKVSKS